MSEESKDPKALFLISRTAELLDKQGIQINTSVYEGEPWEAILKRIDMQDNLVERSRIRYELPTMEAKLDMLKIQLEDLNRQVDELMSKKNSGKVLKTTEDTSLANAQTNLRVLRMNVERGVEAIERHRARFEELSAGPA